MARFVPMARLRTVGLFQTKKRQAKLALVRHLIGGGTFEAFEQARIAAEFAEQEIVQPVLRTGCTNSARIARDRLIAGAETSRLV